MSQFRNAVLIACSLAAVSGRAHAAEDAATIHRLASHGGMSSAAAKRLAAKVSARMARAADSPPTVVDPLRASLSQALVGSPVPGDAMASAKVRLKLYAGLNEFALEAMFAPQPGAIAACIRDLSGTRAECEGLVAAAAGTSPSRVRKLAGGPAPAPMIAGAPAAAPAFGSAQPAGGSRFGANRFGGGYQSGGNAQGFQAAPAGQPAFGGGYHPPAYQQQGGYAAAPVQQGYAPMQQQGYAPMQQQQGYAPMQQQGYAPVQQGYAVRQPMQPQYAAQPQQRPVYQQVAAPAPAMQPQAAYRPAPAPVAMAPVVSAQDVATRKEQYKAQREAYLARQKAEFQERKDKASGGAETTAEAAPAANSGKAAPVVATAKPAAQKVSAPASNEVAAADTKHPVAAAPAAAAAKDDAAPAAKSDSKPALDNSFLDGLLDDPLGGKKK
jgi:hypothetical protein